MPGTITFTGALTIDSRPRWPGSSRTSSWPLIRNRDYFQTARRDGRVIGSIAIDGTRWSAEGARLRWFIVSGDQAGAGTGRRLMDGAVDFCRGAGHKRIFLWTFQGLDRARSIYERHGFRLTEEYGDAVWGNTIVHQKFILDM